MESARSNVQPEPLSEQLGNFAIGSPAPPQLADQFAVGFKFGTWRLGGQIGKSGDGLIAFQICGGLLKNHDWSSERATAVALG
jgi:hypothetical protein